MTDTLRFDREARTRLLIPMRLDIDPVGSTVDLKIDGTWYAAEWIDSPVQVSSTRWEQVARTIQFFAGPNVTPAGAVVLALGPHRTKSRVDKAGDVLVDRSSTITVL